MSVPAYKILEYPQPLMEPAMMPASKYFWKKGYITSSGRLEIIMVAYLSSSAILARSAVLWISAIMPDSGWLWIRMERSTSCNGCFDALFR